MQKRKEEAIILDQRDVLSRNLLSRALVLHMARVMGGRSFEPFQLDLALS